MFQRKAYGKLWQHLFKKEFTILIGARQIGKSTLLKQLYNQLLENGENAYFINLDRKQILLDLNEKAENLFKYCPLNAKGKTYVFIDEIQYLKEATHFLKLMYDEYSTQLKIIATGSSAFYIDRKFKDSLVGRKKIFQLGTLTFEEFLTFKGRTDLVTEINKLKTKKIGRSIYETQLWNYMDEYSRFGGYPAVVLEDSIEQKIELLHEIRDSYIKRDVQDSGVSDDEKFYRVLMLLASQSGNLVNTHEIAKTLRISNSTVENYLYILQKCFHIRLVKPFYQNLRKELSKMPKIYFNDLGLRNVLISYFAEMSIRQDKGQLFENLIYKQLTEQYSDDQLKYWRTADGNEVDFVIETSYLSGFAIETKFSEPDGKMTKYKKFIENYPNFKLDFWWWGNHEVLIP